MTDVAISLYQSFPNSFLLSPPWQKSKKNNCMLYYLIIYLLVRSLTSYCPLIDKIVPYGYHDLTLRKKLKTFSV